MGLMDGINLRGIESKLFLKILQVLNPSCVDFFAGLGNPTHYTCISTYTTTTGNFSHTGYSDACSYSIAVREEKEHKKVIKSYVITEAGIKYLERLHKEGLHFEGILSEFDYYFLTNVSYEMLRTNFEYDSSDLFKAQIRSAVNKKEIGNEPI